METRFLIIDGNSLACRAAFAHNLKFGPDLMTSSGKLTGATYRFFSMLNSILHMVKPSHAVVAWDVGGGTFRNELDDTYKANRERKDDELYIQFADIKRVLEAVGFKNVGITGFEGDDIIGTYTELSKANRNFIVSGDKDSFQLVNENTVVVYPKNGFKDIHFVDPNYVLEKFGVTIDQYVDLKALMGDGGDNVKGIDNCGEKTAAKLLNYYGSLENIAKNANSIDLKGINVKVKAGILEWAPRSSKAKQLVTIRRDVEVPYSFEECELVFNWESAREIFVELEMKKHIEKLDGGEFFNGEK